MSKPAHIKRILIEVNISNLSMLREALTHYREHLQRVTVYDVETPLSEGAIRRRIRYCESFLENLDV